MHICKDHMSYLNSLNEIRCTVSEELPSQEFRTDRWTDRQGDSYIPPKTSSPRLQIDLSTTQKVFKFKSELKVDGNYTYIETSNTWSWHEDTPNNHSMKYTSILNVSTQSVKKVQLMSSDLNYLPWRNHHVIANCKQVNFMAPGWFTFHHILCMPI